jgi:hypothetical protein
MHLKQTSSKRALHPAISRVVAKNAAAPPKRGLNALRYQMQIKTTKERPARRFAIPKQPTSPFIALFHAPDLRKRRVVQYCSTNAESGDTEKEVWTRLPGFATSQTSGRPENHSFALLNRKKE